MTKWQSFRDGFLSAFDIFGGSLPRIRRRQLRILTPGEAARADAEALAGDWKRVGDDHQKSDGKSCSRQRQRLQCAKERLGL